MELQIIITDSFAKVCKKQSLDKEDVTRNIFRYLSGIRRKGEVELPHSPISGSKLIKIRIRVRATDYRLLFFFFDVGNKAIPFLVRKKGTPGNNLRTDLSRNEIVRWADRVLSDIEEDKCEWIKCRG
ncbi:MAG: hypothetical protein QME81_16300 [bacterium]|nr:hypothetical protein [bacterium]